MDQIKELEAKIAEIKNRIGAIDRGEEDAGNRSGLVDQLNISTNQLAELTFNQEKKAAAIEEKVHADDVPFAISGVDLSKATPELIEFINMVVKADRRRIYKEVDAEKEKAETEHEKAVESFKIHINNITSSYEQIIESGKADNQRLTEDNGNLRDHTSKQKLEIDDLTSKLANAATQLDEKDTEIARLNSQIDDYQKAKVLGEREAQNVIEADPAEAEEINSALKKLYVSLENWGTVHKAIKPDGTFDVVPTAELDNWAPVAPVFTPPTNGGSEDNNTFQDATETTIPGNETAVPETQVGGTFPTPTVSNEDNAGSGDTAISQVVGETITRAEFDAVKHEVTMLAVELKARGILPMNWEAA